MPISTDTDAVHLARAIDLARKGSGAVKPNPVVGAVVARGEEVLGEGWHQEYGGAHAEVNAIEACGLEDLADATLYVSLEPCCHEGKTPPCTEARSTLMICPRAWQPTRSPTIGPLWKCSCRT